MPPLKLSEREKMLGLLTIAAAIFFVFYQFLLLPKWEEIGKLKTKARDLRIELKTAEGKLQVLSALEKKAGVIVEKSTRPREEKMLEVLNKLSQAISASNLKLNYLKPLLDSKEEEQKFMLSCQGKYEDLYNFMNFLQKIRLLVLVDSLDIKPLDEKSNVLSIEMTITAFY
ncbi:MAG: type 4a pilus biogenesis protein PilO [Candidatus Margulisiibacteriota bacterium]